MCVTTNVHIGVNVPCGSFHTVRGIQDGLPTPLMTHAHTELMLT